MWSEGPPFQEESYVSLGAPNATNAADDEDTMVVEQAKARIKQDVSNFG